MFLKMVIPGPSNSKRLINVYLEPLIEELLQLWHVGVRTYDHGTYRAFIMRVTLMWTVNDLPTYGMAFGEVPTHRETSADTSRRQLHENDDENEDEEEDSGRDDETDDEEYEAT
ncbi:hypothetical protein Sango_2787300 [Sesamum angolense]|uniref:Uncharacterized protein n=1 Tax=Sesamum angolense TaxID=2727404 RepID=A0AAE1VX62_9LAMI|nr:hypothetical protein Sango_2787300 [Sesamum angolense]